MVNESFMQDHAFLQEVYTHRVTEYFARIMILDFTTEHPLTVLEGKATAGSINIAAGSGVRRTGSLTVVFDKDTFDITNPDNLIAINKKIRISIGINNPFYGQRRWGGTQGGTIWQEYPPTLWFKQGVFIVTGASSSSSPTATNVQIQFIDKMAMLDGTCGGTIFAGISLHDRITVDGDGNITTDYPRIRQIVFEVVQEFGGEHPAKIIINDLPEFGRRVTRYIGRTPIWFTFQTVTTPPPASIAGVPRLGGAFVISPTRPTGWTEANSRPFFQGDDIGYMASELIFPGELVKNAGTNVAAILTSIANTLGNYEFFYDIDGNFVFQRIRHFEMTGEAPLSGVAGQNTPFNIHPDLDADFQSGYLPRFNDDQFVNEFMNTDLVTQISYNPQYSQIKNDFVVWGTRQRDGEDSAVWMHLAIDRKPREVFIAANDRNNSLCYRWFWEVRRPDNTIERYISMHNAGDPPGSVLPGGGTISWAFDEPNASVVGRGTGTLNNEWSIHLHSPSLRIDTLGARMPRNHAGARNGVSEPIRFEWREELYRRALVRFADAAGHDADVEGGSAYDMELRAHWRDLYDPNSDLFAIRWYEHFHGTGRPAWSGYKREIITDPSCIRYWLDIIDTNSPLGQYSVERIGRRTVVEDDSNIHEVLNRQIPDVVFIDGRESEEDIRIAMNEQTAIGQPFMIIQPDLMPFFNFRNSFGSCYEVIRQLMHRHLIYMASASVTSQPMFHLDVNKVVRLNFPEHGCVGNFIINRLSWNIGGAPRMSVSANEAVVIV